MLTNHGLTLIVQLMDACVLYKEEYKEKKSFQLLHWNICVVPDFETKITYSSYVCAGTIISHTRTDKVIIVCQMSQIYYYYYTNNILQKTK
jgi:phage pi2 protein 07